MGMTNDSLSMRRFSEHAESWYAQLSGLLGIPRESAVIYRALMMGARDVPYSDEEMKR